MSDTEASECGNSPLAVVEEPSAVRRTFLDLKQYFDGADTCVQTEMYLPVSDFTVCLSKLSS